MVEFAEKIEFANEIKTMFTQSSAPNSQNAKQHRNI